MKKFLSFIMAIAMVFSLVPLNVFSQTYDPFISYEIGNYGSFVDGDKVISDLIEYSGMNAHPRLIMTEEKFAELKSHIGDGSITAMMLERLRNEANRLVREGITTYKLSSSDHLLFTSQTIQRHVTALALAYNIFGDEIYAEHAYMELEAACYYPDWSPKHFLDTGEMCTAFAFGYDWLYNWMSDDQRNLLRTSMVEKGLNQVMEDYLDLPRERTYGWAQDDEGDNWQLVCTGGTDLVALAIGDEADARSISSQVLTYGFKRAYDFVRYGYKNLDGTYKEGLGYWDYATYYLGLQSSALISATGTDYGLADYEGVRRSADFVCYMSSNIPYSFSFGDDGDSRDTGWAVFLWLGEYLDSPEYSSVRLRKLIDPNFRYEYNMLDYMWLDETDLVYTQNNNPTDWGMVGGSNASFRTSWDVSGLIAAFHVGENDYRIHGHYDLGSFYIENNGTRFFTDLGNENYDLDNRDYSYRLKPEGHNTIVINPSEGTDQKNGINCLITNFDSGNEAYAISDLTEAYEPNGATSAIRGLKMIKDKNCVIVQDEISLNSAGEIYWFAHTTGEISVAADGRSAIVTVGSDRLWVGIMSEGGSFTTMDAIPLPTSKNVPGAADNSKYKKLAIHYTNTKNVTISVACIPLKSGETKPSWTPSVKSLSEWTGGVETSHNFVNQGNGTHMCSGCGAVENHILSAYVSNNNATCTQNGTESATCVCGYKNTRVISGSATGHRPGAPATMTNAQVCTVCKTIIKPALGTTVSQSALPQVTSEPGVGGFVERLYVVALGRG
ncbi:MAG: heparinase II/III-family protein, partial [Saccharofermentans sp.]|nr:heparinase II/III-family protein [Saccharofermentans sp.]